ncbi:MAG: DNA repair exonuclease, partial [Bradyrhizobiaceae bacterium]
HHQLMARREWLEDDMRARALQFSDDCWVEQLKIKTSMPPRPVTALSADDSLDLDLMLAAASDDPEFAVILTELIDTVKAKLPKDLQDELLADDPQQTLASDVRALLGGALS